MLNFTALVFSSDFFCPDGSHFGVSVSLFTESVSPFPTARRHGRERMFFYGKTRKNHRSGL